MSWILALFAFAGIMAVMSTIASVIVEAVHKVFSLRGNGLQEMLRALHDGVVMPLDPEYPEVSDGQLGGYSKPASKFAKEMTKSPSYGGKGRWWWISNIPLLNVFSRKFDNLSKLQFVEQLTQTDYGKRLSGMNRHQVKQSTLKGVISSLGTDEEKLQGFIQQSITTLNVDASDTQVDSMAQSITSDLRILSNAGFPVGRDFFPYCDAEANKNCDVSTLIEPVNLFNVYTSEAIPRMLTVEGIQWFIGMIATAGLIGLGANFWFNVFRAMASFAVQMAPYNRTIAAYVQQPAQDPRLKTGEVRRPKDIKGSLASPGEEPDLDLLTDAFLTVAGKDTLSSSGSDKSASDQEDLTVPLVHSVDGMIFGEMPSRPGPKAVVTNSSGIRKFRS